MSLMKLELRMSIIFVFLLLGLSSFASASISGTNELHEPSISTSRALLQHQKPCPINFEKQNYTIITSKCKGPKYPAIPCCNAFKEFACPFAHQLNDLSNQCAQIMFSYINLKGGYPPGLFANLCNSKQRGLECGGVVRGGLGGEVTVDGGNA